MRTRIEIRNTHYTSPLAGMAARRIHLLLEGSVWAGCGQAALGERSYMDGIASYN